MPDVYVYLPGDPVPGPTWVVSDDINIDRGADGRPVGVEVLDATRVEVDGLDAAEAIGGLRNCNRAYVAVRAERDRYKAALVEIAEHPCDELNGCSSIGPYDGCRTCVAHVALEGK